MVVLAVPSAATAVMFLQCFDVVFADDDDVLFNVLGCRVDILIRDKL